MLDYAEYKVVVYPNVTMWYNLDNLLHREDGPAVEYINGFKSWWINGYKYNWLTFKLRIIFKKLKCI